MSMNYSEYHDCCFHHMPLVSPYDDWNDVLFLLLFYQVLVPVRGWRVEPRTPARACEDAEVVALSLHSRPSHETTLGQAMRAGIDTCALILDAPLIFSFSYYYYMSKSLFCPFVVTRTPQKTVIHCIS